MNYTEEFLEKVKAHAAEPTAKNGVPWPKRDLERWVLAWLECKSAHGYRWPRWAVADEATNAMYAYHEMRSSETFT